MVMNNNIMFYLFIYIYLRTIIVPNRMTVADN